MFIVLPAGPFIGAHLRTHSLDSDNRHQVDLAVCLPSCGICMVRVVIAGRAKSGNGVFPALSGVRMPAQERSLRASGDAEEGTNRGRGQTGLCGYRGGENREGGGGTFVRKRRGRRTPQARSSRRRAPPACTLSPVQGVANRTPTEHLPSMGRPAPIILLSVCASCDFQALLCVRLLCISGCFGKMGRNGLGAAQIKPPHPAGA